MQYLRNVEIHRPIPDWKVNREDNRVQEIVRFRQNHVAASVALDIVKDEFVDQCTYQDPWPGCQTSWRRARIPPRSLHVKVNLQCQRFSRNGTPFIGLDRPKGGSLIYKPRLAETSPLYTPLAVKDVGEAVTKIHLLGSTTQARMEEVIQGRDIHNNDWQVGVHLLYRAILFHKHCCVQFPLIRSHDNDNLVHSASFALSTSSNLYNLKLRLRENQ